MRTHVLASMALAVTAAACVSVPHSGSLGEGFNLHPAITSVDTMRPPQFAWIDLDQQDYVALLLVTPGRGVSLLYPRDSITDNRLSAGAHQLAFAVRTTRAIMDSLNQMRRRTQAAEDSARLAAQRRTTGPQAPVSFNTYLLLVASPQRLSYSRVLEKTSGVSIPLEDTEALNAVAKAVKSTLTTEPREWGGYYQAVTVVR